MQTKRLLIGIKSLLVFTMTGVYGLQAPSPVATHVMLKVDEEITLCTFKKEDLT